VPSFELEFEIYCGKCGAGLCNNGETTNPSGYYQRSYRLDIEPCQKCLDDATQEAKDEVITEYEAKIEELQEELETLKREVS
jgi:hypothetical protein